MWFCGISFIAFSQKDYSSLVNPFIGTGGHGHTFPGASMPFGMMQLSPDTRKADWDGSSGYHYSDSVIYGFSHTHLSGTGIPDYCDVLLMPFTGPVKWNSEDYRSSFSHNTEKASPGYYEVLLEQHKIKVQLAASYRSGMHHYTFPRTSKKGSVLIDLTWRDEVLESYLKQVSPYEISGMRRSKSWAQDQVVFFYIKFDKPIQAFYYKSETDSGFASKQTINGKKIRAYFDFNVDGTQVLKAKIGISAVSEEGAKKNLDTEITDWNFENLESKANKAWNNELRKIEVKGGTKVQQVVFYTALYHTMLAPNIFQDVDGSYRSTDGKATHKSKGFTNYSVFSLWDTYRAFHPLMTIINRQRTKDWINTFLKQYEVNGMLPVWELAGNETFCMIGYHSVPVIVDAYQKGIRGFDTSLALKAMLSYAESDRFGLKAYREYGYIGNDQEHESVSKTLEYAYDDWSIAQFAKMLGNDSVYHQYIRRAQSYKNLFDPTSGHMRGKVHAVWHSPFDPSEINNFFTEGNSWQYSFAVPQDVHTLIDLHGGRKAFIKKLDELFTTSSKTTGREQADVTGLIGQYAHGNEPSHHMAYLYNYAGQAWKTQQLVHKICTEFYNDKPDGLIGNEDCGQMSAWYVLSAMGFYPVLPGSGEYILGTPLFDEAIIHFENGKKFTIRNNRRQTKSPYVLSTKLNKQSTSKSFLLHSELAKGGLLEFETGPDPNKIWGSNSADLPHSSITENIIVPVPFFDASSNKFRQQQTISIKHIDSPITIRYRTTNGTGTRNDQQDYETYYAPITLNETTQVSAFAINGAVSSQIVIQPFYKLPSDFSINVLSSVHSMYTAGGPEALIDGIKGSANWRAGEWQSYYDQDLEISIDLQKEKNIAYAGIHVLQDVSPWILFPRELIIYTSIDGKHFTEAATIQNAVPMKKDSVQLQEIGTNMHVSARYVKIKALNGGKLPAWHESSGQGSHLFISEVVIR